MDRRARRQTASSRSNSTVSDSSFQDKSDSSVPKGASKKKRTQQTVSTPLIHKEILSQFEFVPRLTSSAEEMGRGDNNMDGASVNSTRVLSPYTYTGFLYLTVVPAYILGKQKASQ